jgi:hypothetical protein
MAGFYSVVSGFHVSGALGGWGARIRTWEWRNQNPLPYHLATPHCAGKRGGPYRRGGSCQLERAARRARVAGACPGKVVTGFPKKDMRQIKKF